MLATLLKILLTLSFQACSHCTLSFIGGRKETTCTHLAGACVYSCEQNGSSADVLAVPHVRAWDSLKTQRPRDILWRIASHISCVSCFVWGLLHRTLPSVVGGNSISVLKNSSVNFRSFSDLMTPLWLLLLPLQSITSHFPLLHLKYIAVAASCYSFILVM